MISNILNKSQNSVVTVMKRKGIYLFHFHSIKNHYNIQQTLTELLMMRSQDRDGLDGPASIPALRKVRKRLKLRTNLSY